MEDSTWLEYLIATAAFQDALDDLANTPADDTTLWNMCEWANQADFQVHWETAADADPQMWVE